MGNNGIQTSFYFRGGAQYLYESGNFSGPVLISGFSVRMMQGSGINGTTGAQNFEVYLSTTAATATSLSTANTSLNHGSDLTQVKDSPLSIFALGNLNGDGVTDWSTPISFDTPFSYDPSEGNLIIEFGGNMPNDVFNTRFVDGWEVGGAGLARVSPLNGGGFLTDQLGAIVQFETSPIPEPSSALLLTLAGLATFKRRR